MPQIKLPSFVGALTMCSLLCGCDEYENELRRPQRLESEAKRSDAAEIHRDPPQVTSETAQVVTSDAGGGLRVAFPVEGVTLQRFSTQLRKETGIRLVIDPYSDLPTRNLKMIGVKTIAAKDLTAFVETIFFAYGLALRELKLVSDHEERTFLVT